MADHWRTPHTDARKLKRRYQDGRYGMFTSFPHKHLSFHHVLNLFVAYRWERDHPRSVVPTERYKSWLAKRDAGK